MMHLLDKLDLILKNLKSVKEELGESLDTFKTRLDSAHDELEPGNFKEGEKILNSLLDEIGCVQELQKKAPARKPLTTRARQVSAPVQQIEKRIKEIFIRQRQNGKSVHEGMLIAEVMILKEKLKEKNREKC